MNVTVFIAGMSATGLIIALVFLSALSDRGYRSLENWYFATAFNICILAFGFIMAASMSGAWKSEPKPMPTPIYIIVTATPEADKR